MRKFLLLINLGNSCCPGQHAILLFEQFINISKAMGCGILTTYTQIGNTAGLHGLLVYTVCGAIPILGFAAVGPAIRRKCPEGFILTEWVRQRFGIVTAL